MFELQEMRKSKGLSQTELAKRLGVKPNTFNQYEKKKRTPNIDMVCKIADILEVSEKDILNFFKRN